MYPKTLCCKKIDIEDKQAALTLARSYSFLATEAQYLFERSERNEFSSVNVHYAHVQRNLIGSQLAKRTFIDND